MRKYIGGRGKNGLSNLSSCKEDPRPATALAFFKELKRLQKEEHEEFSMIFGSMTPTEPNFDLLSCGQVHVRCQWWSAHSQGPQLCGPGQNCLQAIVALRCVTMVRLHRRQTHRSSTWTL